LGCRSGRGGWLVGLAWAACRGGVRGREVGQGLDFGPKGLDLIEMFFPRYNSNSNLTQIQILEDTTIQNKCNAARM
jgi:hypothetical protein